MFDFLSQKFLGIFGWLRGKSLLTEEHIAKATAQVQEALLQADVPHEVVEGFLSQIKDEVVSSNFTDKINPGHRFVKIVHDKLQHFLGGDKQSAAPSLPIPSRILVMGLQGSGKTTTIAKLASWLLEQGAKRKKSRRILAASVDFYRPAALKQLKILSGQVGIDFYEQNSSDPCEEVKAIRAHFVEQQYEYLLLDTAGRLHIDSAMMQQLQQIALLLNPTYSFLVLDAMTGQESLSVARAFEQTVGFNGAILSKMDSDTRGGAAFSFCYSLKKPIVFVGNGEKINDLEPFIPERMATRILGMGDMVTLVEKTQEHIDMSSQKAMVRRMLSGNFTLDDFAKQLDMVNKLGPLQKVMRYIPGAPSISSEQLESGAQELKRYKAILGSMTRKERLLPQLLNASRKRRIASGSGTNVAEVNRMLARFDQSKQFVTLFKKSGQLKNFFH